MSPEHSCEVRLSPEAHGNRYIQDAIGLLEELFCPFDPLGQEVMARPHAHRQSKLSGEVHGRQPGSGSHIGQRNFAIEFFVDELHHAA